MAMSQFDLAMAFFAAHVLAATDEINKEHRMSVLVTDLAATVRKAKQAIATAGDASHRLVGSAQRVVARVAEVEAMVGELNAAEKELADALGSPANGGPPLVDGASTPANLPPLTIEGSIRQVEAAYVAPPVVTASTIAAERAAASNVGSAGNTGSAS
jgi:hypothetical protein